MIRRKKKTKIIQEALLSIVSRLLLEWMPSAVRACLDFTLSVGCSLMELYNPRV